MFVGNVHAAEGFLSNVHTAMLVNSVHTVMVVNSIQSRCVVNYTFHLFQRSAVCFATSVCANTHIGSDKRWAICLRILGESTL